MPLSPLVTRAERETISGGCVKVRPSKSCGAQSFGGAQPRADEELKLGMKREPGKTA